MAGAMCGFFQFDVIRAFEKEMRCPALVEKSDALISGSFSPGARISVLHQHEGQVFTSAALWWLLLDRKTLKPDYRYASFNSRSDKLDVPGSLAYRPYRESRCLIPATAFVEGRGDKKHYYRIELQDSLICFGGLLKTWLDHDSGELLYSVSIITLPALPEWAAIHPKSTPLMLPAGERQLIDEWLDPATDVARFMPLLTPTIRETQIITPIAAARDMTPTGPAIILAAA